MSDELRRHIAGDHHQGDVAYQGGDDLVALWHRLEHRPAGTTHLDHAHDEFSARRYGVALLQAAS